MNTTTTVVLVLVLVGAGAAVFFMTRDPAAPPMFAGAGGAVDPGAGSSEEAQIINAVGSLIGGVGTAVGAVLGGVGTMAGNASQGARSK